MVFSGMLVGATPMAGVGAAGLKMICPSASSVSRVATVLKCAEMMMLAELSASGPSAELAATAKCEAVKPQAPCIGAFGSVAQLAAATVGPRVGLVGAEAGPAGARGPPARFP